MLNITQKITHENFCVEHNTKNNTEESFVLAITGIEQLFEILSKDLISILIIQPSYSGI